MTWRVTTLDTDLAAALDRDAAATLQMDEETFRGFYERTARPLRAYLERLTGDGQAADDLLQDAYYRFLRSKAVLESETDRRRYLFRIATNLSRDRHRRRRTQPDPLPETSMPTSGPGSARHESPERRLDVSRALGRLRPRERALLWLAYAQGASHREIADIVGVGHASVKVLLFRARRRLASLLSPRGGAS